MLRRLALTAVILNVSGCARRAPPPPAPEPPRRAEFTPIPEVEAAAVRNPHDHGGTPLCQRCHAQGAAGVTKDPIALCAECHDAARMRHPFRVPAGEHVQGLPLMPGGLVACHTCHDPHDVRARRAGLRMAYSELCLRCHARHAPGDAAGPGIPAGHGAAPKRAH
jgi:predicted CXXCH cytochrome family protein